MNRNRHSSLPLFKKTKDAVFTKRKTAKEKIQKSGTQERPMDEIRELFRDYRDRIETVYQYFITVIFAIYLIFPPVNFIRRQSGGDLYFSLWRDYLPIAAAVFVLFYLFMRLFVWERRTFADLKQRILGNPAWIFLSLLAVWMIISAFVTGFDHETVIGSKKSHTGLLYSLIYILVFTMALSMKRKKHIRFLIGLFLSVGCIVSFLCIYDYYFNSGSERTFVTDNRIFYNSNHLSYYLLVVTVCACLLFLLSKKKSVLIFSILVFAAGTVALFLGNALGCHLALALSLVFSTIVLLLTGKFRWKRFLAVILVLCLVILTLLFVPNFVDHKTTDNLFLKNLKEMLRCIDAIGDFEDAPNSLGSGRMLLWRTAIDATLDKPIFGNGLSRMRMLLLSATHYSNNTVHNELLEFSSNQGIPALLFYLAFVFSDFIRGAKNRKKLTAMNTAALCTAFAYIVSSCFGVTMFYTAPYLYICLALGYYSPHDGLAASDGSAVPPAQQSRE